MTNDERRKDEPTRIRAGRRQGVNRINKSRGLKFFGLWSLILCLFVLLPSRMANACGPMDYEFHGYTFINPILVNKENPYAEYFLRFDDLYKGVSSAVEKQVVNNLTEWRGRFCDLVKLEDLRRVIYDSDLEELELCCVHP